MGRVFKKKAGSKREAEEEKLDKRVSKKKSKKEKEPEPEPEPEEDEDEDVTDEDGSEEDENIDDEEISDEDDDEEDGDESGEKKDVMDFDFEAFEPSEDDRDGIINMLTQTFLRTDIDMKGMAEEIIAKNPHGIVLKQAEDDDETEEDFMIYQLCTTLPLNEKKDDAPKFIKDIFTYLLNRAKKSASSEIYKKIQEIQEAGDGFTGLFVSERLLDFPSDVVPQIFDSIRTDLAGFDKKYKNIIYIQKLRIMENEGANQSANKSGSSSSSSAPPKKKGKMGKAEKKRAAAAALANAEIEFDNSEDRVLFEIKEGKEIHFDFPVHMDVEPGSKFHIIEKEGKKWNPFRRVVIMDIKRFDAFLKNGSEGMIV
ncbi:unnamed protein product [Caenorhabditis brenneri]